MTRGSSRVVEERRDQLTGPKRGELKRAMQLQIEQGIFFILIARNPLKSPVFQKINDIK
jgi:hypothetical protein